MAEQAKSKIRVWCTHCNALFVPPKYQLDDVVRFGRKGVTKLSVECSKCRDYVDCNPVELLRGKAKIPAQATVQETPDFRCPSPQCAGWVSRVKESPRKYFWGCGECGVVWRSKLSLDRAISKIVAKYPYRSQCYEMSSKSWTPAQLAKQPRNYEKRVEREKPAIE